MNKLIFLIVIVMLPYVAVSQIVPPVITPPTPSPGTVIYTPPDTTPVPPAPVFGSAEQVAFDDAYWAAKPPAVRALRNLEPNTHERMLLAYTLMDKYPIDTQIDAQGSSPFMVMRMREVYRYTWVAPMSFKPNPIKVVPGVWFPPEPLYDFKIPVGMIPVSTKISDYPVYQDPPK